MPSPTLNVLALTRYGELGPSTRVRFMQFGAALAERGVAVDHAPLLDDGHLRRLYAGRPRRPLAVAAAYARHARAAARRAYDLVWIEKELLPYVPARAERLLLAGTPYVLDYDDATFHTYDRHASSIVRRAMGDKVARLMRGAALVVAGNDYLAGYAERAGARRVAVLPSVVDLGAYGPVHPEPPLPFTVGWIGSPGSERLLETVRGPLEEIAADRDTRLVLVGASPAALAGVSHETWAWTQDTEVASIQSFHVGIMPLSDTPWERGKCGYKLIQCMGAGRSVVASPVGVNREIVTPETGFLAATPDEWVGALRALHGAPARRAAMGRAGRARVAAEYSLATAAPKLANLLRSAA